MKKPLSQFILVLLGLNGCDGDGTDNVGHTASAGEVIDRFGQSLDYRSECLRSGQSLDGFVTDIAGFQIRKNKHIGVSLETTGGAFFFKRRRRCI